jgi:hypothetical protein
MSKKYKFPLLIIAIGFLLPYVSFSQSYIGKDSLHHNPRIYLSAGSYFPSVSTTLRLDTKSGFGTVIGLEDDVKLLSEMTVFKTDAVVRVKRRSQFAFSFTSLLRNKETSLEEDIDILDTTFYVNAKVKMYFDTYYYALSWRYSLYEKTNWNAGFSVGLRYIVFKTGIDAQLNNNSYGTSASFGAPALLIGVHGSGYMHPRLLARYSLEYFQASIADIDIQVLESNVSVEYFIHKNVGIGGAYSTNGYSVREIPFSNVKGKVNFSFGGFNLFLTARF